jgi:hypothetical protein
LALAGVSIWGVAFAWVFNYQKVATGFFKESLFLVRAADEAKQLFGDNIRHPGPFSWVSGTLNQVKGIVDINYKVYGDKGKMNDATIAFTDSIKSSIVDEGMVHIKAHKDRGSTEWKILSFVLENNQGERLPLNTDC